MKTEVQIDGAWYELKAHIYASGYHQYAIVNGSGNLRMELMTSPLPTRSAAEAALKLWREKQKKPEPTLADEAWEIEREAMDRGEYRVADLASLLRRRIERGGEVKDSNDIKDALKVDALETLHNVIQERDRLAAELERAKAIIDKLPKTADGVPIVPGMELYYRPWGAPYIVKTTVMPMEHEGCRYPDHDGSMPGPACYSTEAAALAAKEQS